MKYCLTILTAGLLMASCNNRNGAATTGTMDTVYGCKLTNEQMIRDCPIDAMGDSVIICKQGTMNVAGSGKGAMTWTEYLASKYSGAEGRVMECKTGKPLFHDLYTAPLLTYKNKKLLVDKRMSFDIYDPVTHRWLEQIELPVWRSTISAKGSSLNISPDSLIFKPPFHDRKAFASADTTCQAEMKRTDHYLYMRTANQLLACALCGDTLSERRLLHLENDFASYFAKYPDLKKYLDEKLLLYKAYKNYVDKGGKRSYFDLSVFPYFYNQLKKLNPQLPPARTTLKPVDE